MHRRAALSLPLWLLALVFAAPARAQWTTDGIPLCRVTGSQTEPVVVPDFTGTVSVAWLDPRSGYNTDVYAQRRLASGAIAAGWPVDGWFATYGGVFKMDLVAIGDGTGGMILAWADKNSGGFAFPTDIKVHRVTSSGTVQSGWPRDGVELCTANRDQRHPKLCSDGSRGAFVVWEDQRNNSVDIYAHHILASGAKDPTWPADGLLVCATQLDQLHPEIVPDGGGGVFIAWEDQRLGVWDLYVQRVTRQGAIVSGWPSGGRPLCAAFDDQTSVQLTADGSGGLVAVWLDRRNGPLNVYAQRIGSNGSPAPGWPVDGIPLCTGTGDQVGARLIADDGGGWIAVWEDYRDGIGDIYAQRFDATGALWPGWPADGAPACHAPGRQHDPRVAPDSTGGAFFVWSDERDSVATGTDVYIVHLGEDGQLPVGWDGDGERVCAAPGLQEQPVIGPDAAGGAYVAWIDHRAGADSADVYLQRILADGPVPTRARFLASTHHDGQTFLTWTVPIGIGWTFRVYSSPTPIVDAASLASATYVGSVGDSSWCDKRLSTILGTPYAFATDSLAAPVASSQGLFVVTAAASASVHYAVTAQSTGNPEDRGITPGQNATVVPVVEWPALARPIYQRTVTYSGLPTEVYTLWAGDRDTPFCLAMANRASVPFDCGVVRGGVGHWQPMLIRPHARQGHFLQAVEGTSQPGEWRLCLDDPLPNGLNTFWYGYHTGYDITALVNPVPTSGEVRDYTLRRIVHTVLWARRTFPIDTAQVVTQGYSMAGVGSTLLALRRPDLIAAAQTLIGKYDFSFLDEPVPGSAFNPGGGLRTIADQQWGTVQTDLPSSDGMPVFDRLNTGRLVERHPEATVPPILGFHGRNDSTMGWAEKIGFFSAQQSGREGGVFYWDSRDHSSTANAAWGPMQDTKALYRYRTDRSFPALSRCSGDDDPGDGNPASGDSVGQINGWVEWDTTFVDTPDRWETVLRLRTLITKWGTLPTPDSVLVDVTPRRLQQLPIVPGTLYRWTAQRLSDGGVLRTGNALPDSIGLLTVPQAPVVTGGVRVIVERLGPADVPPAGATPARLSLALRRGGAVAALVRVTWPADAEGRVDLLDVAGRVVAHPFRGRVKPGVQEVAIGGARVASGIYFVRASCAGEVAVLRTALLR